MKTLPFSSTARATGKRLSNKHISDHCLPISAFHTPIVEKKSKKVKARRPGGVTRPIFRNTDWRGYTYTHISSFYESDMPNFTLFFISVFSALFIYFFLHLGPIFSVVYFFNDWTPIVLLRGGARTLAGYCPGNVVKKRERESESEERPPRNVSISDRHRSSVCPLDSSTTPSWRTRQSWERLPPTRRHADTDSMNATIRRSFKDLGCPLFIWLRLENFPASELRWYW